MKFLIIKTSSIGDIIQAFPVATYLKTKYPQAVVDWVVDSAYEPLIAAHPDIRKPIAAHFRHFRSSFSSAIKELPSFIKELRAEKYDALFDLQGNTKSAFITLFAHAKEKVGFGWKSIPEAPSFFALNHHIDVAPTLHIQMRYLSIVKTYFNDVEPFICPELVLKLSDEEQSRLTQITHPKRPRVMVACGSRWVNKRISEERLLSVLSQMQEAEFYFVSSQDAEELQLANRLMAHFPTRSQLVTNLTLPLWQAVMRQMDLVIAVDSAALALCGTTKTPSRSFFGPTLASIYKPIGDHHVAWQGSCPYNVTFDARCPRLRTCKTGACLKALHTTKFP
jgi:lipopolysaccharide heptosyltransferase I